MFQQLQRKAASDPRQVFLIDGLGALVSASFLGFIMPKLAYIFGMPTDVLYVLAIIAAVLAVYSFTCYFRFSENWNLYLKAIAMANLLYCCLTFGLVIGYFDKLSILGVGYFMIEIIIVVILASIELKTSMNKS